MLSASWVKHLSNSRWEEVVWGIEPMKFEHFEVIPFATTVGLVVLILLQMFLTSSLGEPFITKKIPPQVEMPVASSQQGGSSVSIIQYPNGTKLYDYRISQPFTVSATTAAEVRLLSIIAQIDAFMERVDSLTNTIELIRVYSLVDAITFVRDLIGILLIVDVAAIGVAVLHTLAAGGVRDLFHFPSTDSSPLSWPTPPMVVSDCSSR
jgi:hypothetical protein